MFVTNDKIINRVSQFEKFTKLLSEKFDVEITFDGRKAETDGKVISLPNIVGMTDKEVEFLYCILLHEIGHIRYTQFHFDEWDIKSDLHFGIFNAIEDARMENALLKEFPGAREYFQRFYNEYVMDEKYFKKIFPVPSLKNLKGDEKIFTGMYRDWHSFTMFIHRHLSRFRVEWVNYAEITDTEIQHMFKQVEKLCDNAVLKNTDDAFELATKIYNMFWTKDSDPFREYYELMKKAQKEYKKAAEEAQKALEKLQKHKQEQNKLLKPVREEKKKLVADRQALKAETEQLTEQNQAAMDALQEQIRELQEHINKHYEVARKQGKLEKLQKVIQELKHELAELQQKYNAVQQLDRSTMTAKKAEATQNRQDAYDRRIAKKQQKITEFEQKLEQLIADAATPSNERLDDLYRQQNEVRNKYNEMYRMVNKNAPSIYDLTQKIKALNKEIRSGKKVNVKKELNALQEKMPEGFGILPEYDPSPDWPEADDLQKRVDQQLSDYHDTFVVKARSPVGHGGRNLMTYVKDVRNKLQDIDIQELISERQMPSTLDAFNDIMNDAERFSKENPVASMGYVVSPLDGDGLVQSTIPSDSEKKDYAVTLFKYSKLIDMLTHVFRMKFKSFTKRTFQSNKEEGYLDSRAVYKIPNGLDTMFFEQIKKQKDSKVRISLAVDVSGSMKNHANESRQLAIILHEALKKAQINHEVVGYGAEPDASMMGPAYATRRQHRLKTVVYKDMRSPDGNIAAISQNLWDNADGESLLKIIDRLIVTGGAKYKKMVFVIGDMKPYLSGADVHLLDEHLSDVLHAAEKAGVWVCGMGWSDYGKNFYEKNYFQIPKNADEWNSVVDFFKKNTPEVLA